MVTAKPIPLLSNQLKLEHAMTYYKPHLQAGLGQGLSNMLIYKPLLRLSCGKCITCRVLILLTLL